jgi:uncharacterized protein (DUF1501 family)
MSLQRRTFLQAAAAALTPWPALQALAAVDGSGYKALVCLFMFGGNDANNMLVPTDPTRYRQYQGGRPNLALPLDQLLPVSGVGDYGLHPAMAGMQALVNSGRAAVVANVGPLMVPTTKAQAQSHSVPLPLNLYSHSDQQIAWQSSLVDQAARSGWGGRLLERAVADGTNNRGYSAISMAGSNIWEAGDRSLSAYRVSPSGRFGFDFYDPASNDPLSSAITAMLAEQRSDPLEQTWLNMMGRSIENQRVLTAALQSRSLQTTFPDTGLGSQLRMIALLIAARATLTVPRQCFFCSIGGFDTHGDDQLPRQNELLGEISSAVAAFQAAMDELGTARDVTLFTASDFGRNFPSNGQGTDHAWGSHHFVVGGAVRGNRMVGRFPTLLVDGPDDIGQGTWVPAVATDQLGGELARWFGADAATQDEVFPRLRYFDRDLGLMEKEKA